jgi:hypothetical protein
LKPKAKTYIVANAQEGLKESKIQGYLAANIPRSLTYEKKNYTVTITAERRNHQKFYLLELEEHFHVQRKLPRLLKYYLSPSSV